MRGRYIIIIKYLIVGIDMKYMATSKNAFREQPDSNIFLQHAAIQSIDMMLSTP